MDDKFGLGPGYEMPLGLSNYAAVGTLPLTNEVTGTHILNLQNGNYLSSSGIQQVTPLRP